MITHSGGNSSQQGRHFGTGLGESEDIVNKQQHILTFFVSEIFSNSKSSKSDSGSSTGWFVHLSVHQSTPGLFSFFEGDDPSGDHFMIQIISFSGSFSDSCEYRVTTMSSGHIVDKFLNEDSLSYTGSSEESDLSSLSIRSQKIDDLDTSDK